MSPARTVAAVDPFDLPEWLGTAQMVWAAQSSVRGNHQVVGQLTGKPTAGSGTGSAAGPTAGNGQIACDLLAADQAFPQPVLDEKWRRAAHQSWNHGQVLLIEYDGRLTLAVPGTAFTADLVLETLARLAKAVGVSPEQFVAALQL